jgi:hypothetical protein
VRPVPPAVRFIPPGTALEITKQASAPLASPGSRGYEHLRPEAPAAVKPAAPHAMLGAEQPTATAGTMQPAPQPAARPLLDLLFRSQN